MTSDIKVNPYELITDSIDSLRLQVQVLSESSAVTSSQMIGIQSMLDRMAKNQEELIKLRAEQSHLMRTTDDCKAERETHSKQINELQMAPRICDTNCKNVNRVIALERNQRWGIITILSGVAGMIFWHLRNGG